MEYMMYSRRDFSKLALAGLPLSMALAEIDSRISGVQIGVQSYSFRDRSLDAAIKAMVEDGLGECELFAAHMEPAAPRLQVVAGGPSPDQAARAAARAAAREELRKWRLTVPMEEIKAVRKKFDDA